ncbi:MAG: secretin N-terminal domain-containing protein [Burkholderiaceae bacterium]
MRLGALAVALVMAFGIAPSVLPQAAQAQADDTVSLNFKDADIDTVIGAFGHLLNRTFIIDPRVRGKITVATPQPVSKSDAYSLLLGSLRLQGFTIVSSGRLGKVVPEADAKLQSGPVTAGRQPPAGGDQIVTQIFRPNYESATNLVPVLRPLIAPNNTISAYPNNNTLVITDYAANLQRIARIWPRSTARAPRRSRCCRCAMALPVIWPSCCRVCSTTRSGPGRAPRSTPASGPSCSPIRAATIMLRASSPTKVNLAKELLKQLDVPTQNPGNIRVVYLRNARATKLAQTLQAVLSGESGSRALAPSCNARSVRPARCRPVTRAAWPAGPVRTRPPWAA